MPERIERDHRSPISYPGVIALQDGSRLAVMIIDINSEGCKVACEGSLPIGQRVRLETAGGNCTLAQIRWSLPGSAGLQFEESDNPIPGHS